MNFLTHIFKNLATLHMDFFWVGNPTYFCFLKIGRNYGWIIITIISNITVLVSHNVICFGHFMSMSHGANKKAPTIIPPPNPPTPTQPLPFIRLVILQEIFYRSSFALIRLLRKIMHFQSKTNCFFQLIVDRFCCFGCMCFLGGFLKVLPS